MKQLLNRLIHLFSDSRRDDPVVSPDISRVLPDRAASATGEDFAEPDNTDHHDALVDELSARAENAVSEYSSRFETWLENDLNRLYDAWTQGKSGETKEDIWGELASAAHDLHGAATSYGYPSISRFCGSLCRLLDAAGDAADPKLIELHINACQAAHASKARSPEGDEATLAVCSALEASVDEIDRDQA